MSLSNINLPEFSIVVLQVPVRSEKDHSMAEGDDTRERPAGEATEGTVASLWVRDRESQRLARAEDELEDAQAGETEDEDEGRSPNNNTYVSRLGRDDERTQQRRTIPSLALSQRSNSSRTIAVPSSSHSNNFAFYFEVNPAK